MKNQDRRQFVKHSAKLMGALSVGSAAAALFPGCAFLDQMIIGEKKDEPRMVSIIGGGVSGLLAAYILKKNGIPYRIYEGSRRLGGRVFSLKEFNTAYQTGELGAEWISPQHDAVLRFAKELSVTMIEKNISASDFAYYEDNQKFDSKTLKKEAADLNKKILKIKDDSIGKLRLNFQNAKRLKAAAAYDKMSSAELIKNLSQSSEMQMILSRQCELHFGASPAEVSALHLIYLLSGEKTFSIFNNDKMMRISGGTRTFVQALSDRVIGVIPGQFVRFSHQLVAINEHKEGYELQFQTDSGIRSYISQNVICTLPFSCLRLVRGVQNLSFSENIKKAIAQVRYSQQAKGVLSFSERPWYRQGFTAWSGNFNTQNFWESEPRESTMALTTRSLVSFQLGGGLAGTAGLHTVDTALKDLAALGLNSSYENISQIYNWSQSKWSRGGVSYAAPGQFAEFAGIYDEPLSFDRKATNNRTSQWHFAGEHTSSDFPGTLQGALQSAERAAWKIVQNYQNAK